MKKTKQLLTILAIILVAVLAFSPIKSFATGENLTLTVQGELGGRTLSVYKLFDLKITEEEENKVYYYTWNNLASELFFAQYDTDLDTEGVQGLNTVAEATDYLKGLESNSTALTNIAEQYYTFCNDPANAELLAGKVSRVAKQENIAAGTKSVTFENLDQGYYLVYDETASSATTAKSAAILSNLMPENTTVQLKIDAIDVDKTSDKTSASVGEDVGFTVTSTVPEMIGYDTYTFNVVDTLSKGLTFNNDVAITINGVTYTDFTVTPVTNTDGLTTVTIVFNNFIDQKVNAGKSIVVTYSAKVNSEAATETVSTNEVKIVYSNNPTTDGTGESNTDIVHVYTYEVNITKKNSAGEVLEGAQFVLKIGNKYATFDSNGRFTGTTVDTITDAAILTSGADGKVSFSGIKAGSYVLEEITAPEGYNKPDFTFNFTINQTLKADGTLETATFDYTTDSTNNSAKGYITDTSSTSASFAIDILNAKKGLLPSTGGMGTTIFTIVGIVVMVAVAIIFVVRNRKQD